MGFVGGETGVFVGCRVEDLLDYGAGGLADSKPDVRFVTAGI